MANLITNITDCYEPTAWAEYFVEANTDKNALVQAGIMGSDPDIDDAVMKGGRTIDLPFWNDLPHDLGTASRSKVATDDDTEITPSGTDYGKDIAALQYRTQAWQASPLVKHVAGDDPVQIFIDRQVNWWVRERQRLLLKTLKGVFATTLASTHVKDIASEDGDNADENNLIGTGAVEDTRFLLGDAYDKFTAMIVHSTTLKRMRDLNMIDDIPDAEQKVNIPYYLGLRVFVDDTMTTTAGSTSGYKYDTYLFGLGAIAYKEIPTGEDDPNIEVYREPMKGTGAGSTNVITRSQFILHPRGVAWQLTPASADYPSDSELETGSSWSKVWQTKNIRVAKLVTNG